MNPSFVIEFLEFLNQVKVFHWTTKSYSQHVALGGLYDSMDGLIDKFVETYMSGPKRQPIEKLMQVTVEYYSQLSQVTDCLANFANYLSDLFGEDSTPTDLMNIRDEMLGEVNKTLYLLTLA